MLLQELPRHQGALCVLVPRGAACCAAGGALGGDYVTGERYVGSTLTSRAADLERCACTELAHLIKVK